MAAMQAMSMYSIWVVLLCLLHGSEGAGPTCFKCDDVTDPSSCSKEVTCQSDEGCFASRVLDNSLQLKYVYGCQKRLLCEMLAMTPQAVGRRQTSGARVERDIPVCTQCCYTDRCNQHLCQEHTEPMKLVEGPSNVTATVGDQVNLTCKFSGSPAPVYAWYHETHDVTDKAVTSEGGSTLVLPSVQQGDSGLYQCRALNRHGQASAPPALLIVQAPPNFITRPADVTAYTGERVILHCSGSGFPPPEIAWAFADASGFPRLPDSVGQLDISADHEMLIIHHMTSDLTGTYTCRLKNILGTQTSVSTVRLQASFRPTVVLQLVSTEAVQERNQDVVLSCSFSGDPTPLVFWFYRGPAGRIHALHTGITTVGASSNLTITDPKVSDLGTYICQATNNQGSAEASATLTAETDAKCYQAGTLDKPVPFEEAVDIRTNATCTVEAPYCISVITASGGHHNTFNVYQGCASATACDQSSDRMIPKDEPCFHGIVGWMTYPDVLLCTFCCKGDFCSENFVPDSSTMYKSKTSP